MPSPEPFLNFTRRLDALGLRYMVSGSVAAIFYGEPRLTNDVDIIVILERESAPRIEAAFPADEFYCPPAAIIEDERRREQRGHFNLIHHATGFKADIYLAGRDPLHTWGFARTVEALIAGERVVFAPPEYVIARKLQFFREGGSNKHLRDIAAMLSELGAGWDRTALDGLIASCGLAPELAAAVSWRD